MPYYGDVLLSSHFLATVVGVTILTKGHPCLCVFFLVRVVSDKLPQWNRVLLVKITSARLSCKSHPYLEK
jgi:hypothetical protein